MCTASTTLSQRSLGEYLPGNLSTSRWLDLSGNSDTYFYTDNYSDQSTNNCCCLQQKKIGDANCGGKISGLDYSVWLNSQCYPNQGKICLDLRADFNQDKYIDGLDFVKWLDNRGKR